MTDRNSVSKQSNGVHDVCPVCEDVTLLRDPKPLHSTKETLRYLEHFRDKTQEYFVCISLDSGRRILARRVVTIGLLDVALAHPREVFAGPLVDRAASVVISHNHPSGEASPSKQDIDTTQQLVAAGQILGIPLRDHIIVTIEGYYSFKQNGLI